MAKVATVAKKKQSAATRAAELMGGRAVLKTTVATRLDFVPLVRAGLPYAVIERVGKGLALSVELTAGSLKLPARTLARRKSEGRFDASESERVLRLAEVASWATDIFGKEGARQWLGEPSRALGGAKPLELLDTDVGAEAVRDELGRIEHGVFS